jgi:hypothetical protein
VADSRQPTAIFSCPTGTFPRYYRCKTKRPIRVKADNESKGSFYIRGSIGDAVLPFFFLHQQVVEKDRWIITILPHRTMTFSTLITPTYKFKKKTTSYSLFSWLITFP